MGTAFGGGDRRPTTLGDDGSRSATIDLRDIITVMRTQVSVKADSEVRIYRRCDEHYNQPWQRTHINDPAQKIKICSECQRRAAVY